MLDGASVIGALLTISYFYVLICLIFSLSYVLRFWIDFLKQFVIQKTDLNILTHEFEIILYYFN